MSIPDLLRETALKKLSIKTFTWLLTFVFVGVCLASWSASSWARHALEGINREALPAFSVFVLYPGGWIVFYPLPWLIYAAVLSRRQELSRSAVLVFAGTIFLAASLLLCAVTVASFLAYFSVTTGGHN